MKRLERTESLPRTPDRNPAEVFVSLFVNWILAPLMPPEVLNFKPAHGLESRWRTYNISHQKGMILA